jgi:hypothetical protein
MDSASTFPSWLRVEVKLQIFMAMTPTLKISIPHSVPLDVSHCLPQLSSWPDRSGRRVVTISGLSDHR